MTPSEIITKEGQKVGYDADLILRKIDKAVESKAGIILQKNDSVLLLLALSKDAAEMHLFTMDPPAKVVDSLKYFAQKLKESDLNKFYASKNDLQALQHKKTIDLLDKMGYAIQKSNIPHYDWMITREGSK